MSKAVDPTTQQCRSDRVSFGSGGTAESNGEGTTGLSCLKYDSEGLPVLIRLPDLTRSIVNAKPQGQAEQPDRPASSGATEVTPPAKAAAEQIDHVSRRRRPEHRGTRIGRRSGAKSGHRWLHNLGQIAMAAVLALVLLAIIIAFQDRGANSPTGSSSTVGGATDVTIEFAQEPIGPAIDVGFDSSTALNGNGAKWPPDPSEVSDLPASQSTEQPASSLDGSAGQQSSSKMTGSETLRTAELQNSNNLTAFFRTPIPATRRAPDDLPLFDRSATDISSSQISSGDAHRDSGVLPAWHRGRSVEPELPLDVNSVRRYPSTDTSPISTKPMAVPRFSEDQWRRDALSSGTSQASRPRHQELLPSHQNPPRKTHQFRDSRPRYERSGSGLY